jgi:hypothetical protein
MSSNRKPLTKIIQKFVDDVFDIEIEGFLSLGDSNDKNATAVRSKVDNQTYRVQQHLNDPQRAADLIAVLNGNVMDFIKRLENEHGNDKRVVRLRKLYHPKNVMEGAPNNKENSTSYSISKGEKIVFCVRSGKNPEQFHNTNLMMFVVIHELAHLASVSYGHNGEFMDNFKWLLNEAMKHKLYNRIDFYSQNTEYCGMTIRTTPV